jgi:alpha-D-xyloside xylohydrolase
VNEGFSGLLWTPEVRDAQSVEDLYRRVETVIFAPQALINCWYMKNPPWLQIDRDKNNNGQFMADHDEITAGVRKLLQLRMSFVPYLYSAFMDYHSNGIPPIRALILDYPDDPETREIDDEFMFGPSVLVAPLFAGQKDRPVYLPKGDWYDFWTHQKFAGGRTIQATNDVRQIPLYVKSGALLPMAEPVEFIKTNTCFSLEVEAFGPGPAQYVLYEDDGETDAFKDGKQNRVCLQWNDDGHSLERTGEYKSVRYRVSSWTRIE